ncbi:hypothetical protein OS175_11765 [Marinicella sp. S1101]|uniref:hypothetical protein n=1 Tax=Marinicella marina TaxID=2996016 RepID=UPI002260C0BA|nr:hypothetical protein [Marinicella marina]MCX7554559.1 hypothetical protein [Marinicella marina]MDJ1141057.1 hypothetical protein [Marinicella marina]
MQQKHIKTGFVLAAAMNFSVLLFSKGFTNTTINLADPVVMSNFGLLMIVLWGLAYLAASQMSYKLKWLAAVFAIEKLIYVWVWINWQRNNELAPLYEQDLLAGIFYSIYGLNDLIFMLFFAYVFVLGWRNKQSPKIS